MGEHDQKSGKFVVKVSGDKQKFATGAQRDRQEGKGRYDLVSIFALREIAHVYEAGSLAYGERNWEKGMNLSRFLDSALRHTFQVIEGKRDENHAAQAAWNLMAFIHTREMISRGILPKSLDDLPDYMPKSVDEDEGCG